MELIKIKLTPKEARRVIFSGIMSEEDLLNRAPSFTTNAWRRCMEKDFRQFLDIVARTWLTTYPWLLQDLLSRRTMDSSVTS